MSRLFLQLPLNVFQVFSLRCRRFYSSEISSEEISQIKTKNIGRHFELAKQKFIFSSRDPSNYTRAPHASMAQFWLKIVHLSFSMATTPLLKMMLSYGLRPRLWLLIILINSSYIWYSSLPYGTSIMSSLEAHTPFFKQLTEPEVHKKKSISGIGVRAISFACAAIFSTRSHAKNAAAVNQSSRCADPARVFRL